MVALFCYGCQAGGASAAVNRPATAGVCARAVCDAVSGGDARVASTFTRTFSPLAQPAGAILVHYPPVPTTFSLLLITHFPFY